MLQPVILSKAKNPGETIAHIRQALSATERVPHVSRLRHGLSRKPRTNQSPIVKQTMSLNALKARVVIAQGKALGSRNPTATRAVGPRYLPRKSRRLA